MEKSKECTNCGSKNTYKMTEFIMHDNWCCDCKKDFK